MKYAKKRREKKLLFIIFIIFFTTSLCLITVNCTYFIKSKEITKLDYTIENIKKEWKELEIKKSEKISYQKLKEIADNNNLSIVKERYIKI